MKTINIAGAIDELMIFDDPEYCELDDACRYIQDGMIGMDYCPIFRKELTSKNKKTLKCDSCKAAWSKAKELQKKLCPKCKTELNHVDGCENMDCDYPPF